MPMDFTPVLGSEPAIGSRRDAVHVAIVPAVVDDEELSPGQHVGVFRRAAEWLASERKSLPKIGIVDPFLPGPVKKGGHIWVCLYPHSIVGLRHHYLHPQLDADDYLGAEARQYLETAAMRMGIPYAQLLQRLKWFLTEGYEQGHSIVVSETARGVWGSLDEEKFWEAVFLVLGLPQARDMLRRAPGRAVFRCVC